MQILDRRSFLGIISTITASLSGCQALQSKSKAGSLVIENKHGLPHILTVEISTYSSGNGSKIHKKSGQIAVDAGETKKYDDFFNLSNSYDIMAKLMDSKGIHIPYGRKGISAKDNFVIIEITPDGVLNGGLQSV